MRVILIGYRGSGKTSVGRALAKRRGATFVDADEVLVSRAGRSIRAIFEADGETGFRDFETAVLRDVLSDNAAGVISLGGGVVLRESNRAALLAAAAMRVYLHADADTLHERIHADPMTAANRPALTHLGGAVEEIRALLAVREPLYRAVATHELDVSSLGVDEVVTAVEELMADG